MKKISAFALTVLMVCGFVAGAFPMTAHAAPTIGTTVVETYFKVNKNCVADTYTSTSGTKLPYRLWLPTDYDPNKSYPLVLFFHGAGEAGSDNTHIFRGGSILQRLLHKEEQEKHPCIILAPQCGSTGSGGKWVNSDWGPGFYDHTKFKQSPYMKAAEELLDKVIADYPVDETSLYVSGISMGGYGTWDIISRNPDKFAAAIPVCGGIDESYMEALKGMPIRTFHSKGDTIVSSAGTIRANELLKDHGDFLYTEYDSTNHDAWTPAYATDGLTDWLFAQHTEPKKADATYVGDEGVTLEGDATVDKGADLTINYTVKDGYELESITVNGTAIEFTDKKSGSVTVKAFEGGEIKATSKKITDAPVTPEGTTTPEETNEGGEKNDLPVIIGVAAAAVVVIGAALFFVFKKKK